MAFDILKMSDIVVRLNSQAVGFKSLEGAAELERAMAPGGVRVLPAGYVVPLSDDAGPNALATVAIRQRIDERFALIYAVKDISDPRGESALDGGLRDLRLAAHAALLGWIPANGYDQVEFDGGTIIKISNGVIFWRDRFRSWRQNGN